MSLNQTQKSADNQEGGRIYVFYQEEVSNEYSQLSNIIENEFGTKISEIKLDGKPFMSFLMQKIVGNDAKAPPHVFFNDEYVGGLDEIRKLKEDGLLESKIQTCKNVNSPGEMHQLYRKQFDLFVLSSEIFYFPTTTHSNKKITFNIGLCNVTNKHVAFNIKSTIPISFIVKPNRGITAPYQTTPVSITLLANSNTPERNLSYTKFRVESLALNEYNPEMESQIVNLFKEGTNIIKQTISCSLVDPPSEFTIVNNEDGSIIINKS